MRIQLKKVNVKNEEISPKVLTAVLFSQVEDLPKGHVLKERYVYDYEFELILYSDGASMIIDDKHYNIREGDIIYRKPGQYTQGIMPYSCYLIAVDILNNTYKDPSKYYVYNNQEFQNYCVNPILDKIPQIFQPLNKEKSRYLFESIFKEFVTPTDVSDLNLKTNVLNLICYLYQDSTDPFKNNTIPMSHHFESLKDVIKYIENNIDSKLMLSDFSKIANLSPSHFHKVFTKNIGMTPHEFILKVKLNKAKKLLAKTCSPVSDISLQCGFDNTPYFCHVFKKNINMTPLEFRKKHRYM
ncbi:helix-turn-helix transcriptional regulator [Herbivorax sp. ANBcel31]|uniref:AraC family transcriptional regulator n=1 Tax=Herbivorax sp. ANBcel31 TaxID=3069754 RepID=UPI0027AFB7BD|nr:AraC family transcriptional regulator [Herbivorax sp. ANBcel31]MDQ2084970.1 helix-turn-helix transcriptional regulator [Herbivorax sp. ANBcel31]